MINVFLVDDHPLIIEGFNRLLSSLPEFNVVGSARTATDTFDQLQKNPSAHLILLDLNLPDEDGIVVCKRLRLEFPNIKILLLTSSVDGPVILRLLQAGANGYVLKNTELRELLLGIEKVMCDEIYVSKEANIAMLGALRSQHNEPVENMSLTRREKEVLLLIQKGLTSQKIASQLTLSTYTIETHRKNMLQKFGAHNVQELLHIIKSKKIDL